MSSERRLPADGGPRAPRAHRDVGVIAKACEGISLFQGLHEDDRKELFQSMYLLEYQPNQDIIKQGEEGRNFYVIFQGSPMVRIANSKNELVVEKRLRPGDTFGEVALLHSVPRSATVTCCEDSRVKVWALDRVTFSQLLSNSAFNRRNRYVALLKKVEPLKHLEEYNIMLLADALEPRSFLKDETIVQQGKLETAGFHIIEKGSVSVRLELAEKEVNRLKKGDYFGEVTLLREEPPTASVICDTNVDTLTLDNASFHRLLGAEARKGFASSMTQYKYDDMDTSVRNANKVATATAAAAPDIDTSGVGGKVEGKHTLVTSQSQRGEFSFLKEIGLGMSGVAYLCQLSQYNKYVVVKMMKKMKLLRMNQVENVMRERAILQQFDCPFIVSGFGSFQDKHYLYLAMEFMAGGELFRLLVEKKKLEVAPARFYAAEVLLALEYIHKRGYVYRDLKPENILLDAQGFSKLADLGFCKPLKRGEKTYTTCGTTDYMSPEVMLCKGHDRGADLWSFGVFIFEMLAGFAPFESATDNDRYNKILRGTIVFPDDFNLHAKDIVSQLCTVDVSKRLGYTAAGLEEVKQHRFFAGVDWRAMEEHKIEPPFKPRQLGAAQLKQLHPLKFKSSAENDPEIKESLNNLFANY